MLLRTSTKKVPNKRLRLEETKMKKIYKTPELDITRFEIDKELLGSGGHDPGNITENPWSSESTPEVTTDFADLPWDDDF